jgi:hypothetical protein
VVGYAGPVSVIVANLVLVTYTVVGYAGSVSVFVAVFVFVTVIEIVDGCSGSDEGQARVSVTVHVVVSVLHLVWFTGSNVFVIVKVIGRP